MQPQDVFSLKTANGTYKVKILKGKYSVNNRPSIRIIDAEDGMPIMTATINIPEVNLAPGEVIVKPSQENEGILEFLQANQIVGPIKSVVRKGFVNYAICDLLV